MSPIASFLCALSIMLIVQIENSEALFNGIFKSATPKASNSNTRRGPISSVLVTGASGLIGTRLVQALSDKGIRVKSISRSKGGESTIAWNPAEGMLDRSEIDSFDAIINLAGDNIASGDPAAGLLAILGRWTDAKKDMILSSRVDSTKLLVETIKTLKKKPKVFLSASAVGYYGFEDSETIFSESSSLGSGFLADVCSQWESLAREAPTRVVCMRFAPVLSKKGGVLGKLLPIFSLGAGGVFGSGRQAFSWVSVDDAIDAIIFSMENAKINGPVNICSPNPVTNAEFTSALGSVIRRPTIFPLPEIIGKIIFGQFGEETILGGQKAVPAKLLAAGFNFKYADILQALSHVCK